MIEATHGRKKPQREVREELEPYLGQYIEVTALVCKRKKDEAGYNHLLLTDVRLLGQKIAEHVWILDEEDVNMFSLYTSGKRVRFTAQVYRYQGMWRNAFAWRYGLRSVTHVKRKKATRDRHKQKEESIGGL